MAVEGARRRGGEKTENRTEDRGERRKGERMERNILFDSIMVKEALAEIFLGSHKNGEIPKP